MISIIKEICIFMIIAQAVLLFVPGNSYMKYVRVLVGILMILMITKPIVSLFTGEEGAWNIEEMFQELEEGMPKEQSQIEIEDSSMGIYSSIEEELKIKLNSSEEKGKYRVEGVELKGTDSAGENVIEYVVVKVTEQKEMETGEIYIAPVKLGEEERLEAAEEEALKQQYGKSIGVDPERIEIVKSYG